jgi:hypothetical protein
VEVETSLKDGATRGASLHFPSVRSPPKAIGRDDLDAAQAAQLLERAFELPVAKTYLPLLSQSFTSICGPTSVANVLRSMGVRSRPNPLRGIGLRAMSLDQLATESAEKVPAGWQTRVLRPRTVDELRAELLTTNEPNRRYVANFSRGPLFGRGGGHHSPIGGYLETEDLAFVLDVNASFGPWLVDPMHLFSAINTTADWSTGKTRGLVRFERLPLTGSQPGSAAPSAP